MNDAQKITTAFFDAQMARPYVANVGLVEAATPPGGEWLCEAANGRLVITWNGMDVAHINPYRSFPQSLAGEVSMGIRAAPVMDSTLRIILSLAADVDNLALIAKLASAVIAYVEMPAPKLTSSDDESDEDEDDPDRDIAMNDDPGM